MKGTDVIYGIFFSINLTSEGTVCLSGMLQGGVLGLFRF